MPLINYKCVAGGWQYLFELAPRKMAERTSVLEGVLRPEVDGSAGHETAQNDGSGLCGLAVEKFDEFRDDLIRCFFHEPVSGVTNDHAFNIRRHKPALLNQKIA